MRFQYGKCAHCEAQMVVDAEKKRVICPNCGEICNSKESVDLYASGPKEQDAGHINKKLLLTIAIAIGVVVIIHGIGALIVIIAK